MRADQIAKSYKTYDEFLDSQVNDTDMYYLEDRGIARTIKELGFHGNSEKVTREQFGNIKTEQAVIKKIGDLKSGAKYLHTDRDVFLLELARREDANLNGRLVTIIYIRDRNAKGQEISSYIDYAQRLREEDFASMFAGRARLAPKTTDISHYNWDTNITHYNNTANFEIIFRGPSGIQLKCKKDRRLIHLDPYRKAKDANLEDTTRTLLRSKNYAQVVLFDHYIRFWAKEDDPEHGDEGQSVQEQRAMESNYNLVDAVAASIYEDDVLEIAKNALGVGDLHYEHHGEWAPADVIVAAKPSRLPSEKEPPSRQNLETSVLGTIRDLYDAHKSDVSFGTLGNFTFVQLIEQLGLLLPPDVRQQNEKQLEEIISRTAVVREPLTEKISQVIDDVDELVERQKQKLQSHASTYEFENISDDPDGSIFGGGGRMRSEKPAGSLFRDRAGEAKLFDPLYHMEQIANLQPPKKNLGFHANKSGINPDNASSAPKETRTSQEAELLDAKLGAVQTKQLPFYEKLERRMSDTFTGATRKTKLPSYPKPVSNPGNG